MKERNKQQLAEKNCAILVTFFFRLLQATNQWMVRLMEDSFLPLFIRPVCVFCCSCCRGIRNEMIYELLVCCPAALIPFFFDSSAAWLL